ncbi:hypothetical protein GW17_00007557 [Ensete ventricosum]|nr:hypothetical protein GW17_00007557 [Ensete ventricosum]
MRRQKREYKGDVERFESFTAPQGFCFLFSSRHVSFYPSLPLVAIGFPLRPPWWPCSRLAAEADLVVL